MADSRRAAVTLRDRIEEDTIGPAVDKALQGFLRQLQTEAIRRVDAGDTLTASGEDPLTQGQLAGWWAWWVNSSVREAVYRSWQLAYTHTSEGTITDTSHDAAADYLADVTDRLVRGIQPPIDEDSFDRMRIATAQALAEGWTRPQLAARIAAETGWETDGPYWRSEQHRYETLIDRALDPYGRPGSPMREHMRLHDPYVNSLQEQRSRAVLEQDRDRSYWQGRAARIARTEATGAASYGALRALIDEGWTQKEWVATEDGRTRPSHAQADGQTVDIATEFYVGGFALQMPGDPSAPVEEIVNCRCTIVGVGEPVEEEPEEEPWVDPRDMADEDMQAELERLMSDPDGFNNPRLEELSREMDSRDYQRERDRQRAEELERMREEEEEREAWGGRTWRMPGQSEAALRQEYDTYIEVQYLQAEQELNGVLLSHDGLAAGIDPRDLFTRQRRDLGWASEELQEWFSRNGRMSFPEFRGYAVDDDIGRAARERHQSHGWESEFG